MASPYNHDPELYTLLRSLDTLDTLFGQNAHVILRTDAAPFRVLVGWGGRGNGTSVGAR